MRIIPSSQMLRLSLLLLAIHSLTFFLYSQGLYGGYLFDDQTALEGLSYVPAAFSLDEWLYYLGSGTSSPLGRPLTLLSFLLQRSAWPPNAYGV